jgi:hypothetical protein
MSSLDIFAVIVVVAILFLIYCYVGFSRAQGSKNGDPMGKGDSEDRNS